MTPRIPPTTSTGEDPDFKGVVDTVLDAVGIAVILAGKHIPVFPADATGQPLVAIEEATTDTSTIVNWFVASDHHVAAVHNEEAHGGDRFVIIPEEATPPDEDAESWLWELVEQTHPAFNYVSLADLNRKDIADPGWIITGIWPGDAYGTLAAESKAGKTWCQLDLAVSVATGGKWMNTYQCDKGRVVVFLGEGGERNTRRRLRAICEHKGVDPDDIDDLLIVLRVPHFNNEKSMGLFRQTLTRINPRLVIINPLYFAAAGGEGSNLYSMGTLLEKAQHAAESVAAALMVIHHFNQTGSGTSARRMSGAGPEEWSRVLGAAGHEALNSTRPDQSRVQLDWTFTGGEIATQTLSVIRTVWVDDAKDLTSPMHYSIEVVDTDMLAQPKLSSTRRAVLEVLPDEWVSASDIAELVKESDVEMSRDTVTRSLNDLKTDELAERTGPENRPLYRKSQ